MRPRASRRLVRCRCRVLGFVAAAAIGTAGAPRARAGGVSEPAATEPEGKAAAHDPQAADRAYEEAQQAYQRGEMLVAAAALQRAYALDPRPMFLYQRGHALREAGSCRAAIGSFEAFAEVATAPEDRQAARDWIEHCRQVLATEPEPGPEPVVVLEPEPEPSESPPPPRRPDRWGWAGVGVGAGLLVGGAAAFGASHAVAGAGPAAETEPAYLARERRASALAISGITLMAVGGAVLVAAGIRLGIVASRRRSTDGSSRVVATVGGVALRF
jgi:tetratricopeptide (TPR) repeat protein